MKSDQQPPTNNTELPSWFSGDAGSTSTLAVANQSATSTPPKKRRYLVILVAAIVVIGLSAVLAFFVFKSPPTNCLTTDDYKQISGGTDPIEPFDPKTGFYSSSFEFQPKSSAYSVDSSSQPVAEIQHIAAFYKTYSKKPMTITLHASYINADDSAAATIANERLAKIKTDLVAAGIPMIIISTDATAYEVTADDELPDLLDGVTLSLTSSKFCDQ